MTREDDNEGRRPEEDGSEDDWQENRHSKQPYQYNIFLGKSNSDECNSDYQYDDHRGDRGDHRRTTAGAPLLNGPIPGSLDDPATVSKSDYRSERGDRDRGAASDDDNGPVATDGDATMLRFVRLLRTRHDPPLDVVETEGDGNCLFRAISLQVYGDATMHLEVRRHCLDFMEREADHFRNFVADEDFGSYVARKRRAGAHGNHAEIQAASELYNRSIEVYVPSSGIEPINIFHSEYKGASDAPIRLCYTDGNHYDAIVDPLLPTAGLGLGLPGLQPGLADKLQLEEAKKISDESAMEEKMRLAVEESNRLSEAREEMELREALRKSAELGGMGGAAVASAAAATATMAPDSDEDVYKKKALYLSEIEAADFDLEQAVLASSLESYQKAEQERKPSSSRRGDGRRSRFNSSPRGLRSSSSSPVYRTANHAATASSSPPHNAAAAAAAASSSAAASLPSASSSAYAAAAGGRAGNDADEYPASVQELVMNGFGLQKVLRAYDLVGDNFDDLLSFLLSSAT